MTAKKKQFTDIDREITKKVGRIIATARREKGITQTELSERLNMDQSMICSYEQGRRRIPINQFIKIANAIGVSPGKLLDGTTVSVNKKSNGRISRRFTKRIEEIEKFPEAEKKAIVKTIDALILQYKIKQNKETLAKASTN